MVPCVLHAHTHATPRLAIVSPPFRPLAAWFWKDADAAKPLDAVPARARRLGRRLRIEPQVSQDLLDPRPLQYGRGHLQLAWKPPAANDS
jgi:hypothetical protein